MDDRRQAISSDLQSQWQDHFHMRDQTWRVLQYSILFLLGVIGLEIKEIDRLFLASAYVAVIVTSAFGLVIAVHHRRRQKEKFDIIKRYEHELGLDELIEPVIAQSRKTLTGRANTSTYIVVMQAAIFFVSVLLLVRVLRHH